MQLICSLRFWGRMTAINAIAVITVAVAFNGLTLHSPWRAALRTIRISFLFSTTISSLCAITISLLAPLLFPRVRFPFNWAILAAVLVGLSSSGSLMALGVLSAIGYLRSVDLVLLWFSNSMKVSILVTLIFGIFATGLELLRAQLDDATVALRTKERDEAEARRLAAEAQLASLESRVQPHFLFNTLNSIAALAHNDPARAEKMTTDLASLLRSSLDQQTTPLVPIEDEMRMVERYLEIERVRFGDRLRYRVDVDARTHGSRVPRLAVQTLVENAVKYAVSPRREGGTIGVQATAVGGHVQLDVRDDGPGFDATTLPEGHGLALLRSRLAMLFNGDASMRVESRPGDTRVIVDVPMTSG